MRLIDTGRGRLTALAALPGNRLVASAVGPGHAVGVIGPGGEWRTAATSPWAIDALTASPDGEWLAWCSHGALQVARPNGLDPQRLSPGSQFDSFTACTFTSDGRHLFAVDGQLHSWRAGTWRRTTLTDIAFAGPVSGAVAVAPDSAEVTTLHRATFGGRSRLVRWRLKHPGAGRAYFGGAWLECDDCAALDYSPDGQHLAAICDGQLRVFDARTGELAHAADPPSRRFRLRRPRWSCLAFGPDSRQLIIATGDIVTVFDARSWVPTASYDWGVGRVSGVALAPDGLTGAVAGDGGRVAVFDIES